LQEGGFDDKKKKKKKKKLPAEAVDEDDGDIDL